MFDEGYPDYNFVDFRKQIGRWEKKGFIERKLDCLRPAYFRGATPLLFRKSPNADVTRIWNPQKSPPEKKA